MISPSIFHIFFLIILKSYSCIWTFWTENCTDQQKKGNVSTICLWRHVKMYFFITITTTCPVITLSYYIQSICYGKINFKPITLTLKLILCRNNFEKYVIARNNFWRHWILPSLERVFQTKNLAEIQRIFIKTLCKVIT